MFKIEWKEQALRELEKLDLSISRRIFKAVEIMQTDPFQRDIKKLKGSTYFRLRVGDYRIIFEMTQDTITVIKIGHRQNIYDR